MAMTYQTAFEPMTPTFSGSFSVVVLDPKGELSEHIIHTADPWQIKCEISVTGELVSLLCGTLLLEAKLESIGTPPFEEVIEAREVDLSSGTYVPDTMTRTYDISIEVDPNKVPVGEYDLAVGFTTVGPDKSPGALAAFQHGPALKFIEFPAHTLEVQPEVQLR